jgi:hypothetical protein
MIQTFSRYSFTVVLTMLVALNADIPLRGSMESFNPVEREAPVRGNFALEYQVLTGKTREQVCTPPPRLAWLSKATPLKQILTDTYQIRKSLFLLNRVLRL